VLRAIIRTWIEMPVRAEPECLTVREVETVPAARILLCLTSLHPAQGGIASVNRNVIRALRSIACAGVPLHARALVYHDATPAANPPGPDDPVRFRAAGCRSSRGRFLVRFAAACVAWRPDLVFVSHLHLAVVPYLCRTLSSAPVVLFCHRTEFDEPLSRLRLRAFRAAALRLSNSRLTARRLESRFPDVTVQPCELGLEEADVANVPAALPPLRDAFGQARSVGERMILIVSRLSASERYKGHDQLVDVLAAVRTAVPDAQLVIVGEGSDRGRLIKRAQASGAGEAVLFTGFASRELCHALLAGCRLFAMPSRGDGFGLVYLEAMRFAKPCIASPFDGGSEVVVDGVTGFHVDPDQPEALRAALERLLQDEGLNQRLGRAGLERLNEKYRFEHFRQRLQARLGEVLPGLSP
jgi:phosphatidyl-myo-inositol dimannoside synthase